MNKSPLIINGSTRVNGNTDIIIDKIIEGARSVDLVPSLIVLRDKQVSNCIGCFQCLEEYKCSINDDMNEIRNSIDKSELLIFASPLYWCGVTGLMKTFLDRLFCYYHPQNQKIIAGKKAIIVTPMNQMNIENESKILVEFYNRLFNCIGITVLDMLFFGDLMEKGAVINKPEYLEKAYSIGNELITV